jgi:hypothetical protein
MTSGPAVLAFGVGCPRFRTPSPTCESGHDSLNANASQLHTDPVRCRVRMRMSFDARFAGTLGNGPGHGHPPPDQGSGLWCHPVESPDTASRTSSPLGIGHCRMDARDVEEQKGSPVAKRTDNRNLSTHPYESDRRLPPKSRIRTQSSDDATALAQSSGSVSVQISSQTTLEQQDA